MTLVLLAIGILLASGLAAQLARRLPLTATLLGAGGALVAGLLGLVAPVRLLLAGGSPIAFNLPWAIPVGSFSLELDALSAFFLIPIMGLPALAAFYGMEYLWRERKHKSLGTPWMFFNWLVASMALVVLARNAVLFLIAWELMSLASFFLVCFEHERESVRDAGWTYLVATHLGTAFLFVLFVLLGRTAGSFDFAQFLAARERLGAEAGLFFLLALVGFGTKAGLMPLHVWLPEAHPAAPSHVSAVMSGVMIKTGIYGLLRILTLIGPPADWWGWLLIGLGLTSGILGVLFALAQHDLKRLLAYSSVENVGIILIGLGLGLLGLRAGYPAVAVLGFTGALLHLLNHSIFKGLLFLGAGSVLHATGTRDLNRLGGLLRRMPWTGAAFIAGAVAIAGLPPLNGFIGEFLIYSGAYRGVLDFGAGHAMAALAALAGLALIGGLATACFAKAFGLAFLGEPRSPEAEQAHDPGLAMRLPLALLIVLCLAIGLGAPLMLPLLRPVVLCLGLPGPATTDIFTNTMSLLTRLAVCGGIFLSLLIILALVRRALQSRYPLAPRSESPGTWDCGYAKPTARMQYSPSSFVQPFTHLFGAALRTKRKYTGIKDSFPASAALRTTTPDPCLEEGWRPLFGGPIRWLAGLRRLQAGSVHLYILYIALTLILLLIWKLR